MPELKIILIPYNKKLSLNVSDAFYNKILKTIDRIKVSRNLFSADIPEIGYCGIFLINNHTNKIYVNKETIIIMRDSIIETIHDSRQKVSTLLIKKVLPGHFEELNYFFSASRSPVKKQKRERSKEIKCTFEKY